MSVEEFLPYFIRIHLLEEVWAKFDLWGFCFIALFACDTQCNTHNFQRSSGTGPCKGNEQHLNPRTGGRRRVLGRRSGSIAWTAHFASVAQVGPYGQQLYSKFLGQPRTSRECFLIALKFWYFWINFTVCMLKLELNFCCDLDTMLTYFAYFVLQSPKSL